MAYISRSLETLYLFGGISTLVGTVGGEAVFVPVVHPGLLLVREGLEDFLFLTFGKLCHPMNERCYEHEPVER